MLTQIVLFVLGLAALVAGAELLVRGASKLAISVGISPLVVGLTVVAFGTSSPELAVSVMSAWSGKVDLAIGNVVGSNIFNVLFILGACAVIAPLVVHAQLIRQEVPIMIVASVTLLVFAWDGLISRLEALILFAALLGYTAFLVIQSRKSTLAGQAELAHEAEEEIHVDTSWDKPLAVQIALIAGGLVLLVLGSNWLVDAAITFARALGVSELVIGLTIVAAGTSTPEVATSILATIRGQRDIAVGNVIGSNTFNILGVLGVSGLVAPQALAVAPSLLTFDIPFMLAVAIVCLPIFFTGRSISRVEGWLFLGYYAAYTTYLILAAQQHDLLPAFSQVFFAFVVPITAIVLLGATIRAWRERHPRSS